MINEKYIYVIKMNNLFKIGLSIKPENRLKQLNLGSKAEIIFKKQFPSTHKIERYFHNLFEDKHYSGEWYSLSEEDLEIIQGTTLEDYCESV